MALTATLFPASMCFAGNPIRLDIASNVLCRYTVKVNNVSVYEGSGIGSFSAYIQDIIASHLTSPLPFNNDDRFLIPATSGCRPCSVVVDNGVDTPLTLSFTAFLGGMSRGVLRSIGNGNIFTSRFLAETGNIFFTLRGDSSLVTLKETEISPLVFIYPSSGLLSLHSKTFSYNLEGDAGAVYALNIDYARRKFFADHDFIPNFFTLKNGNTEVINIGITQSEIVKDRYYLRFVSSLGQHEVVELKGIARISEDETSDNDNSFDVFDSVVGGYRKERSRAFSRPKLSVSTGDITEDELVFYQDMLASDDVVLLGYHGQEFKVLPSSSELTFAHNYAGVQSFTIDLLFSDSDDHYSTDSLDSRVGDGRIHTSQFTDQFN